MNIQYVVDCKNNAAQIIKNNNAWDIVDDFDDIIHHGQLFQWFNVFHDGFARVKDKNGMWNYMNYNGDLLSPHQWFDYAAPFSNHIGVIRRNDNKWNYLNCDGKLLSNEWFKKVNYFCFCGCVQRDDNKWNFIDYSGKLASSIWFDSIFYMNVYFMGIKQSDIYIYDHKCKLHKNILWSYR